MRNFREIASCFISLLVYKLTVWINDEKHKTLKVNIKVKQESWANRIQNNYRRQTDKIDL